MVWIIGAVTLDELEKLREIGWKDEDPPVSLTPEVEEENEQTRAFFVDSDVFNIMTSSDWEKENI